MTAGCAVNAFVNVTHAYWIPLNAFLLLQPDYEESAHRMKTRPIGTIIGCCVEYLVYPPAARNRLETAVRRCNALSDVLRYARDLESSDLFHLLRPYPGFHDNE